MKGTITAAKRSARSKAVRVAAAVALGTSGMMLATIAPPAQAASGGNVLINWSIPNTPSNGITNISFPITVNTDTAKERGTYFAQQYSFKDSGSTSTGSPSGFGYTGLQPRPDEGGKQRMRAVFSYFGDKATSNHSNCHGGADMWSGVSCGIDFNAVYGDTYNMVIKKTADRTWTGTAVNTRTGASTEIGRYTLAGNGNIAGYQNGFAEYYLSIPSCAQMPRIDVLFGAPTSTDGGGLRGTSKTSHEYSACVGESNFKSEQKGDATRVTRGFGSNQGGGNGGDQGGGKANTIVSKASGKCLDNAGSSKTDGNKVAVWGCHGGSNQQWSLTESKQLTANGGCLDAYSHGTTPGTKVVLWSCNSGSNQKWTLGSDGSIRGQQSNLCLGTVGNGTGSATAVELQKCDDRATQKWTRG